MRGLVSKVRGSREPTNRGTLIAAMRFEATGNIAWSWILLFNVEAPTGAADLSRELE